MRPLKQIAGGNAEMSKVDDRLVANVPTLGSREVHVWSFDLSGDAPNDAASALPASDLTRAGRFVFDRDRNRFLRGRMIVRQLLAAYLDIDHRRLSLSFNAHGKPYLQPEFELGFNLSHSADLALLAIGRMPEIGVDVEEFTPKYDMRRLATTLFSAEECKALDKVADDDLALLFLTCWTRKEAYLKALGVGLSLEPRTFHAGIEGSRACVPIASSPTHEYVEVGGIDGYEHGIAALAVAGGFSAASHYDLSQWLSRETAL